MWRREVREACIGKMRLAGDFSVASIAILRATTGADGPGKGSVQSGPDDHISASAGLRGVGSDHGRSIDLDLVGLL